MEHIKKFQKAEPNGSIQIIFKSKLRSARSKFKFSKYRFKIFPKGFSKKWTHFGHYTLYLYLVNEPFPYFYTDQKSLKPSFLDTFLKKMCTKILRFNHYLVYILTNFP